MKNSKLSAKGRVFMVFCFQFSVFSFLFFFWWFQGWDGKSPLNLVVSMDDAISVVAVRPEEHRLVVIQIPPTMVIDVSGDRPWEVRALWELSQLEQNSGILESAGWNLLGVPIDGFLRLERSIDLRYISYLDAFKDISVRTELRHVRFCLLRDDRCDGRRLLLPDLLKIVRFITSLRSNRIEVFSLQDSAFVRRTVDVSGHETLSLDRELISQQVAEWFRIGSWHASGFSVVVQNASGERGAGSQAAQILEHMGVRVVAVTDGEGGRRLLVRESRLRENPVVSSMARWFDAPIDVVPFQERADAVLVVSDPRVILP